MTETEQTLKRIMEQYEPRLAGKLIVKVDQAAPADWAVSRPLSHRKRIRITLRDAEPAFCVSACRAAVETLARIDEPVPLPPLAVLDKDVTLPGLTALPMRHHPDHIELRNGAYRIVLHREDATALLNSLHTLLEEEK